MPDDLRLPRQLESDPQCASIRAALAADRCALWRDGTVAVPVLALSDPLKDALRTVLGRGQLQRGLETALAALEADRLGLTAERGERISRLLLVASDGAERFYRQVERALTTHAPRVLACRLEVDSATLGELLYGRATAVKLVMADHKDAVSAILRALARPE